MPEFLDYQSPPPPEPPITARDIAVFVACTIIATAYGLGAYFIGL